MSISLERNNSPIKSNYRKDIDGLRAFAITTVIINHFNKNLLPGGYLGVDIFFVISGFVITSSLYHRPIKNFKDFISGFYERRLKRLVPALTIFVLIISILVCLFNPKASVNLQTGLASLFGISNLYLLKQSTDYFSQSTQLNVFTQTWSLGVEEQFYILFPFIIWFSGYGRQAKNGARNLLLYLGILSIVSLIGFIHLYQINQPAAYFLMPTRFWEMATGSIIFLTLKGKEKIKIFLKKIPPLLIFLLIIGVMYLPKDLAVLSTISVVVLTSLLITSLRINTLVYKIFTNPKIVYIGLISYSLYLWHWSVLSISRWTIGIHWWSLPFQLTLIIGLSITSYKFIEKPFRNKNFFRKRLKTICSMIAMIFIVSLSLVGFIRPLKEKLFTGDSTNKWNLKGFGETKIIKNTDFSTIYLLGDSHAGHYGAAMTYLVENRNLNFIMHPQAGGLEIMNKDSEEHILAPLRRYKNIFKKGDIIIFSSSIPKYKLNGEFTKAYKTFLKSTKIIGMKYFLISPTPIFSKVQKGDTCQKEWYRPSWSINSSCFAKIKKSEWLASESESLILIQKFLRENPEVTYIDTFSQVCPEDFCRNHDKNSLMYKDDHHLTSYGAMKLIPVIETILFSN